MNMNLKYYYEFKTLENETCRVEIYDSLPVPAAREITVTDHPFKLEYPDTDKLEPVRSSGATLGLISMVPFQFFDLYTDDYKRYIVKFYLNGNIYWIGYLDSETYSEDFSIASRYPVEFTASDLNVAERIKFLDSAGNKFTGIADLHTVLKKCLDLIGLPFSNVYLWLSTTADTTLYKDHVFSKRSIRMSNFYDEDGEAMTVREVLDCVLGIFGAVMIQKAGDLYIFDFNTILDNKEKIAWLKFNERIYTGGSLETDPQEGMNGVFTSSWYSYYYPYEMRIRPQAYDLADLGFSSNNSTLEFDKIINNTKMTVSPYVTSPILDIPLSYKDLEKGLSLEFENDNYKRLSCSSFDGIQMSEGGKVVAFVDKRTDSVQTGIDLKTGEFFMPTDIRLTGTEEEKYALQLSADLYINAMKDGDPFGDKEKGLPDADLAMRIALNMDICLIDDNGNAVRYAVNSLSGRRTAEWTSPDVYKYDPSCDAPSPRVFTIRFTESGKTSFLGQKAASILNTTCKITGFQDSLMPGEAIGKFLLTLKENLLDDGNGNRIAIRFRNSFISVTDKDSKESYDTSRIKNILISNIKLDVVELGKDEVPSRDDIELKSYVNKLAKNDDEERRLKLCTLPELDNPATQAAVICSSAGSRTPLRYPKTGYSRKGQTSDLEHLLMRTIHSNYAGKRYKISCDLNTVQNLMFDKITYKDVLAGEQMNVHSCLIDFAYHTQNVVLNQISEDNINLADIPVDNE